MKTTTNTLVSRIFSRRRRARGPTRGEGSSRGETFARARRGVAPSTCTHGYIAHRALRCASVSYAQPHITDASGTSRATRPGLFARDAFRSEQRADDVAGSERISRRMSGGARGVSRGSRGGEGRGARGMRGTQQRAQHACTSESRWPPSPSPPPPCRCVLARVIDGRRRPVARASSRMLRRVGTDAWNQQPTVHPRARV